MGPQKEQGPHFGPGVIGEEAYQKDLEKFKGGNSRFGPAVTDPHFGPAVVGPKPAPEAGPQPDLLDEPEEELEIEELLEGPGFDLHKLNGKAAKKAVRGVEKPAVLDQLYAYERQHPKWTGGRNGVLNAIEERKGELTTPDANE